MALVTVATASKSKRSVKTLHDYWAWAYSDIMENVTAAFGMVPARIAADAKFFVAEE